MFEIGCCRFCPFWTFQGSVAALAPATLRGSTADHAVHLGHKPVQSERFGHDFHTRLHRTLAYGYALSIASKEQDLEAGTPLSRRVGELPPIHAPGQADIGYKEIDART